MVRFAAALAAILMTVVALPADIQDVPEMPEVLEQPDFPEVPVMLDLQQLLANMTDPGELALLLDEDTFEDYLDRWLEMEQLNQEIEQQNLLNDTEQRTPRSGCQIRVNGDLGEPQPVYLRNRRYVVPSGTTGRINLNRNDEVTIACTGSGRTIRHPRITSTLSTGAIRCASNAQVTASWLNGNSDFRGLTCSSHAFHDAQYTNDRCFNNNRVIRVGFVVDGTFHTLFWSCFNPNRLEVLYVWYEQNPPNSVWQTGVNRPSWLAGSFYPGVNINNLYTQAHQRTRLNRVLGGNLGDQYITNTQFMARGHLTARTDKIFATGQRSTFYFINAAPQWQPFNAGNWNWLEQNLRRRIGAAGYHTTIWTGTFGVTQLRNSANRLTDIFLEDGNRLPVPLYFYKVVYDSSRRLGTAFVSINNPYYTLSEARNLQFCTDRCRNNGAFNWINWQPDRIDLGYSFCCDVNDFRRTISHLPSFTVNGLLT